jgi:ribosome-binding protein aMBF1 (putative translation factor)
MRPPTFPAVFGLVVRRKREQRSLSEERLAELAEVHRNYIGLIERTERVPTIEIGRRVASALGVRLSALIQEAEQEWEHRRAVR